VSDTGQHEHRFRSNQARQCYDPQSCGSPLVLAWRCLHGTRRYALQMANVPGLCFHVDGVRRGDLADVRWHCQEPLLPLGKPWTGRPNEVHRRSLNGMLWIDRTGAPWRDLPERHDPVGTASSRLSRWRATGVWHRVLSALQAEAAARGGVDWDLHIVDATVVRAHQHAAGTRWTRAVENGNLRWLWLSEQRPARS